MAIKKKLIHFNNKAKFLEELNAGNILDTSIVFIKDTQEIYTHKQYYSSLADINAKINNKVDKVTGKGLSTNDYTTSEKNKLASLSGSVVILTQAEYDALANKVSDTLYIVD